MDLYFAYGSNLDAEDWRRFCAANGFEPDVLRPHGAATLADECLVFDYRSARRGCGALNIRKQPGGMVDGYLFEVPTAGWRALDTKEGHPRRYRRERVMVRDPAGALLEAQTYRVVPAMRVGYVAPSLDYLAVCRAGRLRYGLSLAQLEAAAADRPARA